MLDLKTQNNTSAAFLPPTPFIQIMQSLFWGNEQPSFLSSYLSRYSKETWHWEWKAERAILSSARARIYMSCCMARESETTELLTCEMCYTNKLSSLHCIMNANCSSWIWGEMKTEKHEIFLKPKNTYIARSQDRI